MRGDYAPSAEFYELVADRQVRSSGPALRAALAGLDTSRGPVLEIGAGTGRITQVIADTLPDATVLAVEPAAPMRAILTSRVAGDPNLRRRVTVVPGTAPDLPLPDRISAAVVFGVAGHLDEAERTRLWAALGERLGPGGVIAVELMGVSAPRRMPPTLTLRERVGRQDYEWWVAGEPAGPDLMRFDNTWRVLRDGETVRQVRDSHEWFTLGVDRLAQESGLSARRCEPVVANAAPVELAVLVK